MEYFTALTKLICHGNQLEELNVSNNKELTYLDCYANQLTELDISNNTKLTELYCDQNQLETLDVSNNKELTDLYCYSNLLKTLDISNNTKLETMNCKVNPGDGSKFFVTAWFDNDGVIPYDFTTGSWTYLYDGIPTLITVEYKANN